MYMALYTLVSPGKTFKLHFFSLHSVSVCASHLTLKWSWGRWDLAPQFTGELPLEGEVTWLARAPRVGRGEKGQAPSTSASAGLCLPHGCPVRPELCGKPWCLFSLFSFWSLLPSSLPGGWYRQHGLWHSKTSQRAYLLLFSPPWPSLLSCSLLYLQPWLILKHSQQSLRH